jgi:hypothetical protein
VLPPITALPHAARGARLRVVGARTTARNALAMFAHSRHGRERGRIDLSDGSTALSDRLLARAEAVAVALGAAWGEEAIATLTARSGVPA